MASHVKELRRFAEFGRKIIGVGRNYRQPGQKQVTPVRPLLFFKPTTSYLREGGVIKIPPGLKVYNEVELGVVIGKEGVSIPETEAMDHVGGYTLALDMTDVDLLLNQDVDDRLRNPWTLAKGFDTSTPVSRLISKSEIPHPDNIRLWLTVDGQMRQDANTKDMIFKIPQLISYISQYMTLEEGDLILTGTPDGFLPVYKGQEIVCGLDGLLNDFKIEMTLPVSN